MLRQTDNCSSPSKEPSSSNQPVAVAATATDLYHLFNTTELWLLPKDKLSNGIRRTAHWPCSHRCCTNQRLLPFFLWEKQPINESRNHKAKEWLTARKNGEQTVFVLVFCFFAWGPTKRRNSPVVARWSDAGEGLILDTTPSCSAAYIPDRIMPFLFLLLSAAEIRRESKCTFLFSWIAAG